MPRKDNSNNPLQIRIQARSVPASYAGNPKKYLKALLNFIRHGEELPRGLVVDLHWRNPASKGVSGDWRFDDFEDAISESNSGFVTTVENSLIKRLRRLEE